MPTAWRVCSRPGTSPTPSVCAIALADIRIAQGRLREAMRTYEQGLQLATEQGAPVAAGNGGHARGHERAPTASANDLDAATQHLLRSQELGEHAGLPQNPYRWRVAMARIREAEGDLDGALDLLDEAERLYVGDFSPNVRPVPALRARVLVAQGRLGEALGWAREQGLSAEDDLSYLREFEHITLARVLLAGSTGGATGDRCTRRRELLERLLQRRKQGGRTGSVIEILVLQALAHQMRGDIAGRARAAERALTLAEPEGYVRIFVDEGAADGGPAGGGREARDRPELRPSTPGRLRPRPRIGRRPIRTLIEPLSERELDVLRLLGNRPGRPGHRPRARRVPEHRADPHQEHLRQARREQPPGSGPPAEELDLLARTRRPSAQQSDPRHVARGRTSPAPRDDSIERSPHQSPHLVMSAHHIRSTLGLAARTSDHPTKRSSHDMERSTMSEPRAGAMRDHLEAGRYEIRLKGHLDARWAAWFDGLTLTTRATAPPSSAARSSTRPRCTACSRKCATPACRWSRSRVEPDQTARSPIQPSIGNPLTRRRTT